MRVNTIIDRYIFKELLPPFAVSLFFFAFVFLMTQILDITDYMVKYNIGFLDVLLILIYAMPFFLEYIIPMAVMLSILLTFLKLSSDNEIIALKSSGISLYRLLVPVLVFCLLAGGLTAFMAIRGLPWGRTSFRNLAISLAATHFDIGIKPQSFNESFKNMILYVNEVDSKTKTLKHIFIEDHRNDKARITIVAPEGRLYRLPGQNAFNLELYNGRINQVDLESKTANTIDFESYDMRIDLEKAFSEVTKRPKDEEEMSLRELRQALNSAVIKDDQYYLTLMEFHRKFSLPFACLAMGILAMPLGIQSRFSPRFVGIMLCLVFFLMYYLLLTASWVFGEAGIYPPLIGMWIPNVVLGAIGVYLLVRAADERPVGADLVSRFTRRNSE